VTFDSLPIPHLDEHDLVRVETPKGDVVTFRLQQFTLPLTTEGAPPMTVGYLRKTVPNRKRIRRRGRA
jgi:hypothetical protein